MKRRHREPTPEEIRLATPEPPYIQPADDPVAWAESMKIINAWGKCNQPERIVEYDGDPGPGYD